MFERLICFEGFEGESGTPLRKHKVPSMEQNCGSAESTLWSWKLGPACSPTCGWVTLDPVPTLSVPWCLLSCRMGPIMITMG